MTAIPRPAFPAPVSVPLAALCHARKLSGEYPDWPSLSNSILGAPPPAKSATRAILRLRWGTPQYCASSTLYAMLHPSPTRISAVGHRPCSGEGSGGAFSSTTPMIASRTALKSSPRLDEKVPGTFSKTIYLGFCPLVASLISLMIRIAWKNRFDLVPSWIPARLPATERSWLTGAAKRDYVHSPKITSSQG